MTATDELRRMLDERGVEWMGTAYAKPTQGHPTNTSLGKEYNNAEFIEYFDGNVLRLFDITPEQAIEATLGPRVQPPAMPEQPPYDLLIDLLRDEWGIEVMWDGLRRFWYVGLTEEGVRKRDEREATLGRGTCRNAAPAYLDFLCSECGFVHYHSDENDGGEGNDWHYCPSCGRKVVNDASVD